MVNRTPPTQAELDARERARAAGRRAELEAQQAGAAPSAVAQQADAIAQVENTTDVAASVNDETGGVIMDMGELLTADTDDGEGRAVIVDSAATAHTTPLAEAQAQLEAADMQASTDDLEGTADSGLSSATASLGTTDGVDLITRLQAVAFAHNAVGFDNSPAFGDQPTGDRVRLVPLAVQCSADFLNHADAIACGTEWTAAGVYATTLRGPDHALNRATAAAEGGRTAETYPEAINTHEAAVAAGAQSYGQLANSGDVPENHTRVTWWSGGPEERLTRMQATFVSAVQARGFRAAIRGKAGVSDVASELHFKAHLGFTPEDLLRGDAKARAAGLKDRGSFSASLHPDPLLRCGVKERTAAWNASLERLGDALAKVEQAAKDRHTRAIETGAMIVLAMAVACLVLLPDLLEGAYLATAAVVLVMVWCNARLRRPTWAVLWALVAFGAGVTVGASF